MAGRVIVLYSDGANITFGEEHENASCELQKCGALLIREGNYYATFIAPGHWQVADWYAPDVEEGE